MRLGLAFLLVVVLAGISLWVGVSGISLARLAGGDPRDWLILWESRVPRMLALVLSGAAMAIAGLLMQIVIRNRFVEPSTTGTVEAAGLGLLVMTLMAPGAPVIVKMAVGAVFALGGTGLFLMVLRRVPLRDQMMVPLIGIILTGVLHAVTTFIAYRADLMQTVLAWTQGDLSGVLRGRYELLWLGAAMAVIAWIAADRFTLAGLGKDMATSLGLAHGRVLALALVIVSGVTAVVVVTVGTIPFLGLIVPNLVSLAMGDNMRRAVPWVAVSGAGLVLVCDILGRILRAPYEIPVGTILGVIGSFTFLILILRRRRDVA
ncbi:ABC transporter permease [Pseudogemmobacter bohemicus]|uniref:ABC transporter permease n=1 Tax=Pseudogemmobacter bohemicus TaxID=2250708 RepID=UPI000DD3372C|nr:iron chelate uptake ABC transporter family permease subunit [Pseudogemmobacter bohemicus]